jgi:hypothetical protein
MDSAIYRERFETVHAGDRQDSAAFMQFLDKQIANGIEQVVTKRMDSVQGWKDKMERLISSERDRESLEFLIREFQIFNDNYTVVFRCTISQLRTKEIMNFETMISKSYAQLRQTVDKGPHTVEYLDLVITERQVSLSRLRYLDRIGVEELIAKNVASHVSAIPNMEETFTRFFAHMIR